MAHRFAMRRLRPSI